MKDWIWINMNKQMKAIREELKVTVHMLEIIMDRLDNLDEDTVFILEGYGKGTSDFWDKVQKEKI